MTRLATFGRPEALLDGVLDAGGGDAGLSAQRLDVAAQLLDVALDAGAALAQLALDARAGLLDLALEAVARGRAAALEAA